MTSEAAFWATIAANPNSTEPFGPFGDWLEEQDDWRRFGFWWMFTKRKRPYRFGDPPWVWMWHLPRVVRGSQFPGFAADSLPFRLERHHGPMVFVWRRYARFTTQRRALEAVCRAVAEREGVEFPRHVPRPQNERVRRRQFARSQINVVGSPRTLFMGRMP